MALPISILSGQRLEREPGNARRAPDRSMKTDDAPFGGAFLAVTPAGSRTTRHYSAKKAIFRQGDLADSIFYIEKGRVKLTVVSKEGKQAVVAILGEGDFAGEGCLAGQPLRAATATALSRSTLVRVEKEAVVRALRADPAFSEVFLYHVLHRNIRIQEDLLDQLFNSSEKRLARALLLLAESREPDGRDRVIPKISQETLAELIGTTRSRVNHFMNKFQRLGLIQGKRRVRVKEALLNRVLD